MNIGFENSDVLRQKLRGQVIGRPIMGGIQVKKVYLTNEYAIHLLRRRGASSLNQGLREKVDGNRLLNVLDRYINKHQNVLVHSLKQNTKILIELFRGNFHVLSKAKLGRTLNSLSLTLVLQDMVDPFIYLDKLRVWKSIGGLFRIPVVLRDVVVKNRNDRFLDSELAQMTSNNNSEGSKELISKALILDERLWSRGRFNTDLIFMGNITIRNGEVVLRDLGAITDSREEAEEFLRTLAAEQILETKTRLSSLVPDEIVQFYEELAAKIYSKHNFDRKWKQNRTEA